MSKKHFSSITTVLAASILFIACGDDEKKSSCDQARTCADASAQCGTIDDGCGKPLNCGTCSGAELCGVTGTPNVCAAAPTQPNAPSGISPAQSSALSLIQDLRARIGVPYLTMVKELNTAAQAHATYGKQHAADANCQSTGHDEKMGCAGFTGTEHGQRVTAAGYKQPATFEIVHFLDDPETAVPAWLITLWHRIPLIHPSVLDFGYGSEMGWQVLDAGQARPTLDMPNAVSFYPYEGATVDAKAGAENPEPPALPAGCSERGMYVSVLFDYNAKFEVETHELFGPKDELVEHTWVAPTDSAFLWNSYAMVPCALESGKDYKVHVKGKINDVSFDRWSSFKTK